MSKKPKAVLPRVLHTTSNGEYRIVETSEMFEVESKSIDAMNKSCWEPFETISKREDGAPDALRGNVGLEVLLEVLIDFFCAHVKPLSLSESENE